MRTAGYLANTIALLISSVEDPDNQKFKKFYTWKQEYKNIQANIIYSNISSPSDSSLIDEQLLNSYAKEIIENKMDNMIFLLIKILNRALEPIVNNILEMSLGIEYPMNDNYDETDIMIIPRYKCLWEHKNKGKKKSITFDSLLSSVYYIRTKDLKGYNLVHIPIDFNNENKFESRKSIKFGVSPIYNLDTLIAQYYLNERSYAFSIKGLKNTKALKTIIISVMKKAIEEKVDIMIFPEMLGNYEIISEIQNILEKEIFKPRPILTICPTVWKNGINRAVVLDETGTIVAEQFKNHSFLFPNKKSLVSADCSDDEYVEYLEDIKTGNDIYVLHIKDIGRVTIPICIDLLDKEYRNILINTIKSSLILCPAYSTGTYDFSVDSLQGYSSDCAVVWCNTCIPLREKYNDSIERDAKHRDICAFLTQCGKKTSGFNFFKMKDDDCYAADCMGQCFKCLELNF